MLGMTNMRLSAKALTFILKAYPIVRLALLAALFMVPFGWHGSHNTRAAQRGEETHYRFVIINRTPIGDATVYTLERQYGVRIPDGRYWYDRVCGAWGVEGGPTAGFIYPGLKLGGPLRPDASNGNTRVFINGRELHVQDVLALQRLGPVYAGRYWLNAQGDAGYEGEPAFCNLIQLAHQAGLLGGGGRKSVISGMYDSGIGRVLGNGDFISGNSSWHR